MNKYIHLKKKNHPNVGTENRKRHKWMYQGDEKIDSIPCFGWWLHMYTTNMKNVCILLHQIIPQKKFHCFLGHR